MALSEHEQKLLEELERGLYQNEADVVSTAQLGGRAPNYRAIGIGTLVGVVGLIAMLWAVQADSTIVGVIGFIVLFSGVMVAVSVPGKLLESPKSATSAKSKPRVSFMDQLNERWEKRRGGDSL
ncbi:MAG: DUF3040 domain-containing protein [Pontimonas sp.]